MPLLVSVLIYIVSCQWSFGQFYELPIPIDHDISLIRVDKGLENILNKKICFAKSQS